MIMRGLLLISAGIDSPIAGYLMKKKGLELKAIHFDNQPLTDDKPVQIVQQLLKLLDIKDLFVVEHGKNQVEVMKNCTRKYQCLLCRRFMFRIAEQVAIKEKCDFIITGENLAQVCSQTLENLTTAMNCVKMPILRPLLCNDKNETIVIARRMGTYELSTQPSICCNAVPKHPKTNISIEEIEREEQKIDVDKLVDDALRSMKYTDFI